MPRRGGATVEVFVGRETPRQPVIAFRRLARRDFPLLSRWFAAPHVAPWWREPSDAAAIEQRYGPAIDGDDPAEIFVVEHLGTSIGLVQRYLLVDNPTWQRALAAAGSFADAAGIDYLIGEEAYLGRGLGRAVIGRFVEVTFARYPQVTSIVVTVDQRNERSFRALERVGFRRIWAGEIVSEDPSDEGPSFVYVADRPGPPLPLA